MRMIYIIKTLCNIIIVFLIIFPFASFVHAAPLDFLFVKKEGSDFLCDKRLRIFFESFHLSSILGITCNFDGYEAKLSDIPIVLTPTSKVRTYPTRGAIQQKTTIHPTMTSSPRVTNAPPTVVPHTNTPIIQNQQTVTEGDSHAFGLWDGADAKYSSSISMKYPICTKAFHDTFFVIGPDGKRYPTWHPPVAVDPQSGVTCAFGHEHGRDPAKYAYWDEIRKHFAYDANKNGVIEAGELVSSGIPFGYVNEQLDMQSLLSTSNHIMRHEDHVGHKVEYANGEGDLADGTDKFDESMMGGVVVPVNNPTGSPKFLASGIRCYYFDKIHQGVHSPDALTNNLHELIRHTKCISTRSDYPNHTSIVSGMIAFGSPGEFTEFCSDARNSIIRLGTNETNAMYPHGADTSRRNILTRSCVERTILVPSGSFSAISYEDWIGQFQIRDNKGKMLFDAGEGQWEVLDSIRYYNPNATNKIGYMADLCYETLGGRRARGGVCDEMTEYGKRKDIAWNNPFSGFRGVHRGQYLKPPTIRNSGGKQYLFTDSFGGHASEQPFVGSIRQRVDTVNADASKLFSLNNRIVQRMHDDGESTVHAPN